MIARCKEINLFVLSEIARSQPRRIMLHANWSYYFKGTKKGMADADRIITQTLARIRQVSPASEIHLVGGVPQWSPSLPVVMVRSGLTLSQEAAIHTPILPHLRAADDRLHVIATRNGATFTSALDHLCQGNSCQAVASIQSRREPIAFDYGHLTEAGSHLLASQLVRLD